MPKTTRVESQGRKVRNPGATLSTKTFTTHMPQTMRVESQGRKVRNPGSTLETPQLYTRNSPVPTLIPKLETHSDLDRHRFCCLPPKKWPGGLRGVFLNNNNDNNTDNNDKNNNNKMVKILKK